MPVLKDNREVKKVTLPVTGITIEIRDGLLASDVEDLSDESNQGKQGLLVVTKLMASWDAEDADGNVLEINYQNIGMLPIKDIQEIQKNLSFVNDFLAQATKQDTK